MIDIFMVYFLCFTILFIYDGHEKLQMKLNDDWDADLSFSQHKKHIDISLIINGN